MGDGRVKFPEFIQELSDAGFSGPYSLEVEGEHGEDQAARLMAKPRRVFRIPLSQPSTVNMTPWATWNAMTENYTLGI